VRVNWFFPIEKEENIVGLRWYEHTHPAGLSKSKVYIYKVSNVAQKDEGFERKGDLAQRRLALGTLAILCAAHTSL
jgi:hypothetical protein